MEHTKRLEVNFSKSRYHQLREMQDWCYDNFGDGGYLARPDDNWSIETAFGNSTFRFKNDEHATLFALKWA